MLRILCSLCLIVSMQVGIAGCGNDPDAQQVLNASNGNIVNPGQDNPPTIALVGLEVKLPDKDKTNTISAGETLQLTAIGIYSDMTTNDVTGMVTWKSNGDYVASVDNKGKVTAVSPGEVTVEAAFGLAKAEKSIIVEKKEK